MDDSKLKFIISSLDTNINSYRPIPAGRVHNTYRLSDGSMEYFIKIATQPDKIQYIKRSGEIITKLKNYEIESYIPEIVEYTVTDDYAYIMTPYYHHKQLNLDSCSFLNLIDDCVNFFGLIHSQDTQVLRETVPSPSYSEWIRNFEYETIQRLEKTKYSEYIPHIEQTIDWIENRFTPERTLIYNDLYLPNIRLNGNGSINRVVDWERCMIGDIAYDIAKFEVRTVELYSKYTPYNRKRLCTYLRKLYGVSSSEASRIDAYKSVYSIRTMEKLFTLGGFEDWEKLSPDGESENKRYEEVTNRLVKEFEGCL